MEKYLEFVANHTLLVVALSISFFVLVFSELRRKASGLINIDPTAAVTLMNNLFRADTLLTRRIFRLTNLTHKKTKSPSSRISRSLLSAMWAGPRTRPLTHYAKPASKAFTV